MTIFDDISYTYDKLKKAKEKLIFLEARALSPRSNIISDMPRCEGGAGNPLEEYLIKKEEVEGKIKRLTSQLEGQWATAVRLMNRAKIDKQTKKMMFLRFCRGMKWAKCAAALDKEFPNQKWNVNKCFRKYREVLCRTRSIERRSFVQNAQKE